MKRLISGHFSSISDAELITATFGTESVEAADKPQDQQKYDTGANKTTESK